MAGSRVTEFKKLTLESLTVGEEFVSDDHLVLPEDIDAHGFAVEDDHPFIKPVYAGDRLTAHGIITDKHPDQGATRVVVEVWVENQHGEKTAVGHATGLVP
jgi:hypothetical protein